MASEDDLIAFIGRQRELLAQERNADIERSYLVLSSCSPKLLEIKGLALNNLGVAAVNIGLGGKSLIELERPSAYHPSTIFPPHTFRNGDIARIEDGSTSQRTASKTTKKSGAGRESGPGIEGVVYKVTDTRIVLAVTQSYTPDAEEIDPPERSRIVKLANSVTYDRMDKAIDQLERSLQLQSKTSENYAPMELTPLTEVLMGRKPPSTDVAVDDIQFLDPSLNPSQKDAVKHSLRAAEIALIHGPPGTGKTHTLVEIIRQLVAQEKRVLVCGASNLAVDNLLERLLPHGVPVTRLGHPARVLSSLQGVTLDSQAAASDESQIAKDVKEELESVINLLAGKSKGKRPRGAERKKMWDEVKVLRKEYRKREGVVVNNVMGRAKVVLATCHSSGGRQLYNSQFDVLIIDEATQALEAVCWIPILKSKKLILAGDPMQLPPTILSMDRKDGNKAKDSKRDAKGASTTATQNKTAPSQSKKQPPEPAPPPNKVEEEDGNVEGDDDLPETPATSSKKLHCLKPSESLEVTLFERLEKMYGSRIKRMLTVQYRMHQTICEFPSDTLYGSQLECHPSVEQHLLRDLPGTKEGEDFVDVLSTPVVFFDTAGCEYYERLDDEGGAGDEGSRRNENEATVVRNWVEKLVEAGLAPAQIAVITPYQAQVTALVSLLRPTMPDLEIGTVDGMQGREKEAIVLSLVRSNDKREVGFLKERRRLNVAMTRPRRHLCVVGDSATVSNGNVYLKKWMAWLEENADVRYGGFD